MVLRVALVFNDPNIATLVYGKVVEATKIKNNPRNHHEVLVYSRNLDGDTVFSLAEGTHLARQMGFTGAVIFPDTDFSQLNGTTPIRNEVPIAYSKKLAPIIVESGGGSKAILEAEKKATRWSRFIADIINQKPRPDAGWIGESLDKLPRYLKLEMEDPRRHENGLIAVLGGMPTESGLTAIGNIAEIDPAVATLLYTDSRVPDPFNINLRLHGVDTGTQQRVDHLPHHTDSWNKLKALKPKSILIACNTIHADWPRLKHTDGRSVHIVQAGLRSLPQNSQALVLATDASIVTGIFHAARNSILRSDVKLIIPEGLQQQKTMSGIWDVTLGNTEDGGKKLYEVIKYYWDRIPGDKSQLHIIGGCTEVMTGLNGYGAKAKAEHPSGPEMGHLNMVDNLLLACHEAVGRTKIEVANGR